MGVPQYVFVHLSFPKPCKLTTTPLPVSAISLKKSPLKKFSKNVIATTKEKNKEIDFWVVMQPAFLELPEMQDIKAKCPQPCAAIVSTNPTFVTWLKLRLEYVYVGEFEAPSDTIPDPLASLASV